MKHISIDVSPLESQRRQGDPGAQSSPKARGIKLPQGFERSPSVLAMGSDRHSALGLFRRGQAIIFPLPSQWVPSRMVDQVRARLPKAIAIDLDPVQQSAQRGRALAAKHSAILYPVQSCHAQVVACLVEQGYPRHAAPVLGLAFGDSSHGEDGTLWGGEFLSCRYDQVERLATLKPTAMIGGDRALHEPWRSTYTHLISAFDWDDVQAAYGHLDLIQFLHRQPRVHLNQQLITGTDTSRTSSVARWFDAVAAALQIHLTPAQPLGSFPQVSFTESLEHWIEPDHLAQAERSPYPFSQDEMRLLAGHRLPYLDPRPMWQALLEDLSQREPAGIMAARFVVGLAEAIAQLGADLAQSRGLRTVVLAGSLFHSRMMADHVRERLTRLGYEVHQSQRLSSPQQLILGQGAIAAAQAMAQGESTSASLPAATQRLSCG